MSESFPRQHARTRGFSLGLPRSFSIAADGSRVAFLRSASGGDPLAALWVLDVAEGRERVVHAPRAETSIGVEERDRRERTGERQTGVVAYATDLDLCLAVFTVGDRLVVADLVTGDVEDLRTERPAFDPRPDPTGRRVAYVADGSLHVIDVRGGEDRRLAGDDDPDVHWGTAEFVAAEEMERRRGFWWSPDGERLLACRVDEAQMETWHISSPIDPAAEPRAVRYPRAGTRNADVTLHVLGIDGSSVEVAWDRARFEYLAAVSWTNEGPPLVLVQSRDQRELSVLAVDPDSGRTESAAAVHDDRWTDLMPGVPAWLPGGRLLTGGALDDTRCLMIDGQPVTPSGLQVDRVVDADDDIVFLGTEDPIERHVRRLRSDGAVDRVSAWSGVHDAVAGGRLIVVVSETETASLPVATLIGDGVPLHTFERFAETSVLTARPRFVTLGSRALRSAVLTPGGVEPERPLPVLLDPYGGPHFARVTRSQRAHRESQWFADQGFVVLVIDGRGTPMRGIEWERSIHRRYVDPALEDQVDGLQAASERFGFLDLSKVAIRGWSYGGYLTLAALLRRPDVFHAGVSGAPVVDMAWYDTHYAERYLGTPQGDPEAYERADVVKDAAELRGELLIVHGMADDNVYVTHSLRMSKALMESGRRHALIPLSGITHRPTDEAAAENMLRIEVEFLRRALGLEPDGLPEPTLGGG